MFKDPKKQVTIDYIKMYTLVPSTRRIPVITMLPCGGPRLEIYSILFNDNNKMEGTRVSTISLFYILMTL